MAAADSAHAVTPSGKRMSAASLQRHREYESWLENLPNPTRDDTERNTSMRVFMLIRRRKRECARLQGLSQRRSQARREQPSAAALQRQREYFDWLQSLPPPRRDDEERDESWQAFMEWRRREQLQQHNASRRKSTQLGRPPNPQRQAMLAARRERREQKERSKRAQEDAVWAPRVEELRGLGATNVELHHNIGDRYGDQFWLLPPDVPPPSWVCNPPSWAGPWVPSHVPERHRRALGKTKLLRRGRDYKSRAVHTDYCTHLIGNNGAKLGILIDLKPTKAMRDTGRGWLDRRGACEKTVEDGMESDSDGSLWESCSSVCV